ncbi:TonB-dependent receptor [Novosphingobium humi]|uniref:TonB-dependent receptor n=1 Tax=Novosphingobium humi TaxID=2282397 RepID=A0ABY7U1T6_9SPHN|nr:TonB-dependent receptor [Novosphingobium humi]WCT78114.1 TonB-dependent receptor [Novosphingobium humi]
MFSASRFLAAASCLALSAPALAAEDAAPPTGDTSGLTDIVVTATKRETNLQKTPISISVVNAEEIKKRHVQSLFDLGDGAVPSLRVAPFEARVSALTIGIRGIVPLDANQPAREQGVGIYIDGVYLGRQHGVNAALFDLERIEVLKGPQGTLFGRNTEGGALSIVAKAPSGKFGGRIQGGIGNYGSHNAELHLDLPEYKNFSVKLDGVLQYQDPITKNPMPGQLGWGYYDRKGLRAAVRWKPAANITNDFSFDVSQDKNTPFYSQLLNYNPNGCVAGLQSAVPNCYLPGTAYTNLTGTVKALPSIVQVTPNNRMAVADIGVPQQASVDTTRGYTNSLKWKVTPDLEIRSITAWRQVTATQWDNSGGAHRVPAYTANGGFSRYSLANLWQAQFSQEFQAVGNVGKLDYVGGLFYFNEHVSDNAATPNSNTWNADGTGYTVNSNVFTNPFASIDRASEVWSKSYAVYGQGTYHLTDALHLTVGGRYTNDKKRGVLHMFRNVNYDVNTTVAANNGYAPLNKSWNRFNPMATLAWDVTSDAHAYAKFSTGYRAGGASSRTANYLPFNPEDVTAYELGIKSDLFNRKVRVNLAGYIMDRKSSQVDVSSIQTDNSQVVNGVVVPTNINILKTLNAPGITKIRGIEADITARVAPGLTLNASYAYTYTDIPKIYIPETAVYQKFYIVYTPRNAASASADYEVPLGGAGALAKLHIDANYSQSTQAFDQFATHNDASLVFNGRLALADIPVSDSGQKLTVTLWSRNMFNTQYVFRRDPSNSLPGSPTSSTTTGSISNILGDYGNFNAPRTFGIDAAINF